MSYPDDPLIASIDYVISNISAPDLTTPIRDSSAITDPIPNGHITVDLLVPAGNQRLFTIQLFREDNTPIFWARITLDVADNADFVDTAEIVQAGFGAATRIKLFRDYFPWSSYAMDSMFAANGFTPGTGDNQYQILSSEAFDTVNLIPSTDLVIISNDQDQEFYDNFNAAEFWIDRFMHNGGTIFWEVCDLGWAEGSMDSARIVLPRGIRDSALYDHNNYITSSELQLVAGLDSVLTGNYASHKVFYNLPIGTISYTVDSRGLPTLVAYNYGLGWVFATGQPLEFNYDRIDSYNIGYLLPHTVRFLLGLNPASPLRAPYNDGISVDNNRSSAPVDRILYRRH